MKNKKERILSFVRLGVYAFVILYAFIFGNNVYMGMDICPVHRIFSLLCSTCGATRAALSLIQLDIRGALDYNPVFTLGVFPIMAVIAVEDVFTVVYRELTKKHRESIAEGVFRWLGF